MKLGMTSILSAIFVIVLIGAMFMAQSIGTGTGMATLSLSTTTWVYQGIPNSAVCSGSWHGSYPCTNTYDDRGATFGTAAWAYSGVKLSYVALTYNIPSGAKSAVFQWEADSMVNATVPSSCFISGTVKINLTSYRDNTNGTNNYAQAFCWNGASWVSISKPPRINNGCYIYEEAMWWGGSSAPTTCGDGKCEFTPAENCNTCAHDCVCNSSQVCNQFGLCDRLRCSNGWAQSTCTDVKPIYCNASLSLVNNCALCGCASGSCNITSNVCNAPKLCGNAIVETGETCDGSNFNGQTCYSLGFFNGTLKCSPSCTLNTSGCMGYSICGNKICNAGENCSSCAQDCGKCSGTYSYEERIVLKNVYADYSEDASGNSGHGLYLSMPYGNLEYQIDFGTGLPVGTNVSYTTVPSINLLGKSYNIDWKNTQSGTIVLGSQKLTVGSALPMDDKWTISQVNVTSGKLMRFGVKYGNAAKAATMKFNFLGTFLTGLKAGETVNGPMTSTGAPKFTLKLAGFGSLASSSYATTNVQIIATGQDTDKSSTINLKWTARDGSAQEFMPLISNAQNLTTGDLTALFGGNAWGTILGAVNTANGQMADVKWTTINDKAVYLDSVVKGSSQYAVNFKIGGTNGKAVTLNVNPSTVSYLVINSSANPIICAVKVADKLSDAKVGRVLVLVISGSNCKIGAPLQIGSKTQFPSAPTINTANITAAFGKRNATVYVTANGETTVFTYHGAHQGTNTSMEGFIVGKAAESSSYINQNNPMTAGYYANRYEITPGSAEIEVSTNINVIEKVPNAMRSSLVQITGQNITKNIELPDLGLSQSVYKTSSITQTLTPTNTAFLNRYTMIAG